MRVDLHMHTGYSADAAFPQSVEDKVRACCAAGLEIIGITDHLDFYRTRGPSENRDVEACLRDIRAAKQAFASRSARSMPTLRRTSLSARTSWTW